ncbi:armadillo repeat-containing protein 5 isoform X1 [Accipiter gentilis]|uniref:armadillo repeat-containing protein 5 isoform X1 n=1 Tax=Astur gentilis TaxID=8957 RepID=UPI0021107C1A|nr:armadillo repeat-containing protein 5 isoform X1 [Accipiter gentilis]
MSEPLGWCVEAVRAAAEPGLARALLALRTRHTRRPGGAARFRERGGLGPLLELLGPERPRRTLDLALSVLGNCCTEPGCRRQARRLGGVPRLVALLSSPGPESVQNRVARTLANLALEPDGARDVLDAGAGPLLVSLAASCGTPECLHSAARALRILGAAPAPRRALGRAGAVRALASRLASLSPADPACPAVARALRGLTDSPGPSADDVAPALPALAALAAHAKRDHRQPALGAIANACARAPLRPALGAAGAVEAVTEEVRRALASPNVAGATVAVRALCLLCREAVNRARVRAAGGLGLLLRLLAEPRARPWRPRVLLALAAFAYDQEALAALEARGLVPLLADVLRARADEEEDEEEEDEEEEDEEEEDEAAASCDLPRELPGPPGPDAAAGSLRGLKSWLLSEASSPPPSPPSSTVPPHCPSPPRRRLPPMGALALPRGVGEGDPWLPEAPALLLLGRLAAADEPSRALATAPVVSGLLRYLTGVPAPAPRAARVLQRLTGHPAFLGALVRAYVPSLLHSWLVLGFTPPQAEELSRPGGPRHPAVPPHPRQARLKELGEGLLRNLGAAAAAPFGVGLLTHMLRCGAPPARLACATALPLLARPASPARGLLWGGGAVALLLSAVARGPTSPYEPPPAFALYAADAIALLRGHAGDTPGDIGDATGDGEDTLGRASAEDLQVHGDGDTRDPWEHGDAEDLWGQADRRGESDDVLGENGDLQRPPDRHKDLKDPWGHPDTFGDAEDTWGHVDGHATSPADGHGDVGDAPGCTDGHGDPWGHADGLGDADDSWGPPGSPCPLYPPPLLSPVSPCPQVSPDPFPPGSPCPQVSQRAAKRPRSSSCPQLSPNPPNFHSPVAPRPPKCPLLSSSPPLSSNLPNSCPRAPLRCSNPRPQLSPRPQVSPNPLDPCPQVSPTSSNPSPQPSPCLRASLSSSGSCPRASPSSSNPSPPPSPAPQASPTPPAARPPVSPMCPYARTPHDLLLLPNGAHPGVPAARAALTRGSPVLGAMLGGAFAEARQAAVTLGCAPRHPLLLLLHFVHGCRGHPKDKCPFLSPPVSPAAADAAVALARRYLVDGFEGVMVAAVAASPGALWALAERWGCAPLATRAAQAILGGQPHDVAPRLVRVAQLARCPPRLARALMAAVAPRGVQPHLEMGEPWGGGDPLLRLPGDANGDLGDVQEDLGDLEDDFGVPYEDLGDNRGDLGNVADPFGDPSGDVGDPLGEDDADVEVKGPL